MTFCYFRGSPSARSAGAAIEALHHKLMNKKILAHVLGVVTVAIWGVTFVSTRYAVSSGLHATELFLLRFAIAYVCIWAFEIFHGRKSLRLWADNLRDEIVFVFLGVTGGSLYFVAENVAVGLTHVNNVSFIVCTAPLITIVLGRLFTHSVSLSARLVAGSLVALVGVAVVIFNGQFVLHLNPAGDLLALVASICWAAYSLLIKRVSDGRYSAVFLTRKVFAYGIITVLPFFAWDPWHADFEMLSQPAVWGNLIFLGFVASFVCFVVWSWVIKQIGAIEATNYVYLNPLTTVVASAVALNEPMTSLAFIGSGLILLGVFLANTAKN